MSKTSQCIKMLEYLYSRGIVSIGDIAEHLETNARNVPEYKKELESAGYIIDAVPGRYGGYRLDRRAIFPAVKLSAQEKSIFANACQHLYAHSDYLEQQQFDAVVGKIASVLNVDISRFQISSFAKYTLSIDSKVLADTYSAVKQCTEQRMILNIEYENIHCEVTTRNIHCYKMYIDNGYWFVLAYDERSCDMRYFKLSRIRKYSMTYKLFRVLSAYKESDYLGKDGMQKHGEWHRVTLLMTGDNASRARETTYGKDQEVVQLEHDKLQVTFSIKNTNNTLPMIVLGMGSQCEVLEPQWLKADIVKLCEEIKNKY